MGPARAAASFAQTYDRDGNVTSEGRSLTGISGDAGANTQSFTYDGANRVTAASGLTASATYAYDRDTNRTSATIGATTTTYSYDRTAELISRTDSGVTTYLAYDAYGNQTSSAPAVNLNTAATYDLADRLTSIDPPAQAATTFTFDALGRFMDRVTPTATDTYRYVGTSESVWRITSNGVITNSALDPSGARVATKLASAVGYLLPDLHANLAAVVNSGETALLAATRYDAFGQTAASYDSGGAFPTPWRFQGRLDVSPTSDPLYDAGARFYDPGIGAFTQLDSYAGSPGDPLSLNRFAYAEANPWTLIDPSGHVPIPCGDAGGCGGGTATSPEPEPPTRGHHKGWGASRSTTTSSITDEPMPEPGVAVCPVAQCWYTPPLSNRVSWDAPYHEGLSGCGILFPPCDATDAAVYAAEGDWLNTIISGLSILPVGDILKVFRKASQAERKADAALTGARDAFRWTEDHGIPAIGREADVAFWADTPGVRVLSNEPGWSRIKNERWIDSIAEQRQSVFVATDRSVIKDLLGSNFYRGEGNLTMLQVEIKQLREVHHYEWFGQFLVPPRN